MSRDRGLYDLVRNRRKASADHVVGALLTFVTTSSDGTTIRYRAPARAGQSFTRTAEGGKPDYIGYPDAVRYIGEAHHLVLSIDTVSASHDLHEEWSRLLNRTRVYLPRQIVGLVLERVEE